MRKPTTLSLDSEIENEDGDTTELIETIADDRAINLEAYLDARTWRGVLGIAPFGGPNKTFAKPIETFFERSIGSAPPSFGGQNHEPK